MKTQGTKGPNIDGSHSAGCIQVKCGTSSIATGEAVGWLAQGRTTLISRRHPWVSKFFPKQQTITFVPAMLKHLAPQKAEKTGLGRALEVILPGGVLPFRSGGSLGVFQ